MILAAPRIIVDIAKKKLVTIGDIKKQLASGIVIE